METEKIIMETRCESCDRTLYWEIDKDGLPLTHPYKRCLFCLGPIYKEPFS